MIEDMNDKDILDKARMEGMNQGIWLAVQELAHDGRWTQAAPEKVRVLSPAWYRAAVEFQGRPEQERLAFCSWCCCHGGCNLCMDISKYNIKGLKIYGG